MQVSDSVASKSLAQFPAQLISSALLPLTLSSNLHRSLGSPTKTAMSTIVLEIPTAVMLSTPMSKSPSVSFSSFLSLHLAESCPNLLTLPSLPSLSLSLVCQISSWKRRLHQVVQRRRLRLDVHRRRHGTQRGSRSWEQNHPRGADGQFSSFLLLSPLAELTCVSMPSTSS